MGICNQARSKLGRTRRTARANPIHDFRPCRRPRPIRGLQRPPKHSLQPLIQHQMQHRLDRPQITRAQPPIQPLNALVPHNLSYAVDAIPIPTRLRRRCLAPRRLRPVKLQPRLHEPNRVRRRGRGDPRADGCLRVHQCRVLPAVQPIRPDPFAIPINVELDRLRWHHARETGP